MSPDIIEKPWGVTRCIHSSRHSEVWHASIRQGGASSVHRHRHNANEFYVVQGWLMVRYPDERSERLLYPGDTLCIVPGVWHQFRAITNVELIETYYLIEGGDVIHGDIERQEVAIEC